MIIHVGLSPPAPNSGTHSIPSAPAPRARAADRAHRIGQASAVNVHFLHVRGSVDDVIWAAIQSKLESVGQALDGEDRGMEVSARTMPVKGGARGSS